MEGNKENSLIYKDIYIAAYKDFMKESIRKDESIKVLLDMPINVLVGYYLVARSRNPVYSASRDKRSNKITIEQYNNVFNLLTILSL